MKAFWSASAAAFSLGCCITAFAEAQQPQQGSPQEQALSERVLQEINAGVQCRTAAIASQRQIDGMKAAADRLQERINELEAKYEPKVEPKK